PLPLPYTTLFRSVPSSTIGPAGHEGRQDHGPVFRVRATTPVHPYDLPPSVKLDPLRHVDPPGRVEVPPGVLKVLDLIQPRAKDRPDPWEILELSQQKRITILAMVRDLSDGDPVRIRESGPHLLTHPEGGGGHGFPVGP